MFKLKKIISVVTLIFIVSALMLCVFVKEKKINLVELLNVPNVSLAIDKTKVNYLSEDDVNNNLDLVLINKANLIKNDVQVDLIKLSNGEYVNSHIYPSLQKMFDDARAAGIYPNVHSGYRSFERQKELYDAKYNELIRDGYSKSDATQETESWVAVPGSSEHQLGIAIDINADKIRSSNGKVYNWMSKNAHLYGFILRYPESKIDITGVNYEPWHFRYVGIENATKIYESGLSLEEYLKC